MGADQTTKISPIASYINKNPDKNLKIPKYIPEKLNLKLIKKLDKISKDIIEEAIPYPNEKNAIILA